MEESKELASHFQGEKERIEREATDSYLTKCILIEYFLVFIRSFSRSRKFQIQSAKDELTKVQEDVKYFRELRDFVLDLLDCLAVLPETMSIFYDIILIVVILCFMN